VLDLSKIEAGKMGLHLETVDVPQVIEEMVTDPPTRGGEELQFSQCPRGRERGHDEGGHYESPANTIQFAQ